MNRPVWAAARKQQLSALRTFVTAREEWCVPFAGKLALRKMSANDRVLICCRGEKIIAALQVSSSGVITPVFSEEYTRIADPLPPPFFLLPGRPFSIMGRASWAEMVCRWYDAARCRRVLYHLMARPPGPVAPVPKAAGIRVLKMSRADAEKLYPLQRGYELEEVLLEPELFNERICRANLARLLSLQHLFAAANSDGHLLAKANTNALGITCEQIGGVYTLPSFRGQGIARMVMEALIRDITSRHRKACLFVKQDNPAALRLYRNCGFDIMGNFVIIYPGREQISPRISAEA